MKCFQKQLNFHVTTGYLEPKNFFFEVLEMIIVFLLQTRVGLETWHEIKGLFYAWLFADKAEKL